jgi:VIT1/CCC1 family predicted Fe2+/Mn2+ transporter
VFTQLLQFWVPRSAEFDAALVASMRLPFFFSSFDSEAERVTVKILGTLGRFENVDQLPEPTITAVLASQALRQRMVAPLSVEESIAAVESAILAENVRAQASAERERLLRKTAERAVAANEVALAEKDRELTRLAEEARVREGALQQLNISMAEAANDKVRMREALHFMFGVLLPVLAGALLLGIGAGIVVSYFAAVPVWQSVAACAVGALLLGMGYIQSRPEWATVTMIWPTLARVPHGWRLIAAGVISLGGYVVLAIFGDPIVSLLRSFMGK